LLGEVRRRALLASSPELTGKRAEAPASGAGVAVAAQKGSGQGVAVHDVNGALAKGVEPPSGVYRFQTLRSDRATRLAAANVRQLLVILNVVDVSSDAKATSERR